MSRIMFPSIAHKNVMYTAHDYRAAWKEADYSAGRDSVASWAGWFDTYGDGTIQHTPEMPVMPERLADYCASFAGHALAALPSYDIMEMAGKKFHRNSEPTVADVQWAASVKYIEGKPRWYNRDAHKVSANSEKRHDKRWNDVPPWADGHIDAIVGLLSVEYDELIDRYARVARTLEIAERLEIIGSGVHAAKYCRLEGNDWDIDSDFTALRSVAESFWAKNDAERRVKNAINRAPSIQTVSA